ncbi:hypothetical protein D9M68_983780 [compost metagenome]
MTWDYAPDFEGQITVFLEKNYNYLIIRLICCIFAALFIIVHQKKEEDDKETPHSIGSNTDIAGNGQSVCLYTAE